MKKLLIIALILALLIAACEKETNNSTADKESSNKPVLPTSTNTPEPLDEEPTDEPAEVPTEEPTEEPTPEIEVGPPSGTAGTYGPAADQFPDGYNPLNGMSAQNPETLGYPAMLISVSNFPASARPQSGLSFAPMVYDMYIGEGMNRFLAVFYGSFPTPHTPVIGDCEINEEIIQYSDYIIGNQVWLDEIENGVKDPSELGVAGVCVDLLDAVTGEILASTTTNSNGYYGFDLLAGKQVVIHFHRSSGYDYTIPNATEDEFKDSDVDQSTGQTEPIEMAAVHDFSRDAGLIFSGEPEPTEEGVYVSGFVWDDLNVNGLQDEGEPGVAGIPVNLYRLGKGGVIATTATDIFGNYLFYDDIDPDRFYAVDFNPPLGYYYTSRVLTGDLTLNNDVTLSGKTEYFEPETLPGQTGTWDTGFYKLFGVGPVRSGRLPYIGLSTLFPGACLAFAGQYAPLNIPVCELVFTRPAGVTDINENFYSLDRLEYMTSILEPPPDGVNYSGNVYSDTRPPNGIPISEFNFVFNSINYNKWVYDPLAGGWLRYHDMADASGELYPSVDRITGKQLIFNNVIIIFNRHEVLNDIATIIDIPFGFGDQGQAWLFRDGYMYPAEWNTFAGDWENSTYQMRPFKFVDLDGNPIPLHPGNTWVHITTLDSCLMDRIHEPEGCYSPGNGPEEWYFRFNAPEY